MPQFSERQLREMSFRILQAVGVGGEEAAIVAGELAEANLVGHDSHGIIRLKQYLDAMAAGTVRPGAPCQRCVDLPSVVVLDGGMNFGQVVATEALRIAIERARVSGTCTIFCRNSYHVGRLGSFTRRAADEGFVALMAANGPGAAAVAPWGGVDGRIGTNPISFAAPGVGEPIVLDTTTSATAEGKIRVAQQKGESVPDGWIIDRDGNPTTDPAGFYDGGAILPLGGSLGFKGFGFGVMVDILSGILSGTGVARTDVQPGNNGVWLYVVDVARVTAQEDYTAWIERYVAWIKSSRCAAGIQEVFVPGEIETQRRAERLRDGVTVPEATWQQTRELADRVGVSLDDLA